MLKLLEKSWPYILLALSMLLYASLLYYPHLAQAASGLVLFVSVGFMLALAVQKSIQAHRSGQIDRSSMWRRIALDLAGIALMLALVVTSGRWAAEWVSAWAQAAGWNVLGVTLSALLAALAVGLVMGWAVQWLWSKLARRLVKPQGEPVIQSG